MTDTSFLADPSCLSALGTAERAVIDGLAVQTFSAFRVEATCGCVLYVLLSTASVCASSVPRALRARGVALHCLWSLCCAGQLCCAASVCAATVRRAIDFGGALGATGCVARLGGTRVGLVAFGSAWLTAWAFAHADRACRLTLSLARRCTPLLRQAPPPPPAPPRRFEQGYESVFFLPSALFSR